MVETSAAVAATLLVLIAAFQISIALGAPWGEVTFTQPASRSKVLSNGYRIVSTVSTIVILLAAWVVAARGHILSDGNLGDRSLTGITWLVAGYLVLNAVTDLGSASFAKRWIGSSTKALTAVLCIIVVAQSSRP